MSNFEYQSKDFINTVNLAKSGNVKSLEELIRYVQRDIFTMFCYLTDNRQDISDLTQEALIKMAKNIKTLKEPKSFKSWLNHIVTNVFYDYTRRQAIERKTDLDEDKLLEIKDKIGCEPGEKCFYSEFDRILKAALLSLPNNLRIVIILREYEGLSYEDISKITNTTIGTVKSRISRARLRLQNQLKEFI